MRTWTQITHQGRYGGMYPTSSKWHLSAGDGTMLCGFKPQITHANDRIISAPMDDQELVWRNDICGMCHCLRTFQCPTPVVQTFYVTFSIGTVFYKHYATFEAYSTNAVIAYCNQNLRGLWSGLICHTPPPGYQALSGGAKRVY